MKTWWWHVKYVGFFVYIYIFFLQWQPSQTCLAAAQCPLWRVPETGATSWLWAWRSTTQLTHLSAHILVLLRTTARPHTPGTFPPVCLTSQHRLREEVSQGVVQATNQCFLGAPNPSSATVSCFLTCAALAMWKCNHEDRLSPSACPPSFPLCPHADVCRSSPENKVSDKLPNKSESVEMVGSAAACADQPADDQSRTWRVRPKGSRPLCVVVPLVSIPPSFQFRTESFALFACRVLSVERGASFELDHELLWESPGAWLGYGAWIVFSAFQVFKLRQIGIAILSCCFFTSYHDQASVLKQHW